MFLQADVSKFCPVFEGLTSSSARAGLGGPAEGGEVRPDEWPAAQVQNWFLGQQV